MLRCGLRTAPFACLISSSCPFKRRLRLSKHLTCLLTASLLSDFHRHLG
jgi:hypothetical protein